MVIGEADNVVPEGLRDPDEGLESGPGGPIEPDPKVFHGLDPGGLFVEKAEGVFDMPGLADREVQLNQSIEAGDLLLA